MERVELGDRVQDQISGVKGIAMGITDWLYGCRRVSVQPEGAKDNRPGDMFCVDAPQLKVLKKRFIERPAEDFLTPARREKHGDRPDAGRAPDVMR